MAPLRRVFEPAWWGYVRYRYPERLAVIGGLIAITVGVAGYMAVSALGNSGMSGNGYALVTTTVKGKVRVLRVMRTVARSETLLETRTLPGGTAVVMRRLVRYRPLYRRKVIHVHGKSVTVRRVVTNSRTHTVVQSRTQSQTQTVNQTQTVTRTETPPAQTVTVTGPGTTVTDTVTVPTTVTITVTVPTLPTLP
jgi:hypothetical protein